MRTKTRSANLEKETIQGIRLLYAHGVTAKDTAEQLGIPKGTIQNYYGAWRAGLRNPTEYANKRANAKGFTSHQHYQAASLPSGRSPITQQEAFEASIRTGVDMDRLASAQDVQTWRRAIRRRDQRLDLEQALERLAEMNERHHKLLVQLFYQGLNGREAHGSKQAAYEVKVRALENLRTICTWRGIEA